MDAGVGRLAALRRRVANRASPELEAEVHALMTGGAGAGSTGRGGCCGGEGGAGTEISGMAKSPRSLDSSPSEAQSSSMMENWGG